MKMKLIRTRCQTTDTNQPEYTVKMVRIWKMVQTVGYTNLWESIKEEKWNQVKAIRIAMQAEIVNCSDLS